MFSKKNLNDIPIEKTPHGVGSRKLVVGKSEVNSSYFEAFTYGYLPSGGKWIMHKHDNLVEICVVIKGTGILRDILGKVEMFGVGDRFIFPASTEHEIDSLC